MAALVRGQAGTTADLNWFIEIGGSPFNPFEVGYRIFSLVAGPPGAQIFPAVAGEYHDATDPPARFGDGRFYAYDSDAGDGWAPALDAQLGTYRIEWRWKDFDGGAYSYRTEDFCVVAAEDAPSSCQYISVQQVRDAGITEEMASSAKVLASIQTWQAFIDRATRQWFCPREMELFVDGSDTNTLHFGVPIISVSEIEINLDPSTNVGTLLTAADYRVYSPANYLHGKKDPKIRLTGGGVRRDIHVPSGISCGYFARGAQNHRVACVLGCVQEDGSAPELIQRALLKLVVEKLLEPLVAGGDDIDDLVPPVVQGVLREEWTDGHRVKFAPSGGELRVRAPGLAGITNDQEILNIIKLYKAPLGIATTSGV